MSRKRRSLSASQPRLRAGGNDARHTAIIYTAASLIGLIAAQKKEPNQQWICDWSFRMGRKMAAREMRFQRRRKRRAA